MTILNYAAVEDCGIPVNPAWARIQTEGGIEGIGHTLMENVTYAPAIAHAIYRATGGTENFLSLLKILQWSSKMIDAFALISK